MPPQGARDDNCMTIAIATEDYQYYLFKLLFKLQVVNCLADARGDSHYVYDRCGSL